MVETEDLVIFSGKYFFRPHSIFKILCFKAASATLKIVATCDQICSFHEIGWYFSLLYLFPQLSHIGGRMQNKF